jgi:hypothetical protein
MKGNTIIFLMVVVRFGPHRHGRLSWHDGRIPEEEIWVKIRVVEHLRWA